MRIAVLQVNSQADKAHNIAVALDLVGRAAGVGADLAVLPEYVDFLGPDEQARAAAEPSPGPTCRIAETVPSAKREPPKREPPKRETPKRETPKRDDTETRRH